MRLIDATPVPCGASRETVKRSELAGWAGYGYCAAHSRWYWGLKLYLITTPDGMPVAWCLASPKIGRAGGRRQTCSRHAARTGALRPGLTLIGDKGFAGREFEDLVTAGYGLHLVRPDRRDEAPRHGSIGWIRQWIEIGQRHPQRPARPGTPRRPHHRGRLRPDHPAAAGHGRLHLAQLGHRRTRQAVADRL